MAPIFADQRVLDAWGTRCRGPWRAVPDRGLDGSGGALTRTFGVERIEFWISELPQLRQCSPYTLCVIGQKLLLIVAANEVPYF
jgi:hypothetical protein